MNKMEQLEPLYFNFHNKRITLPLHLAGFVNFHGTGQGSLFFYGAGEHPRFS